MTVVFGTAAVLRDAGGRVPLVGVAIKELILADALPLVVKVNVLQNRMLKKMVGKGGTCSVRMLERCRMQEWADGAEPMHTFRNFFEPLSRRTK